jgi:hypothetical protein
MVILPYYFLELPKCLIWQFLVPNKAGLKLFSFFLTVKSTSIIPTTTGWQAQHSLTLHAFDIIFLVDLLRITPNTAKRIAASLVWKLLFDLDINFDMARE